MDLAVLLRFFKDGSAVFLFPRHGRYEHETDCLLGKFFYCLYLDLRPKHYVPFFVALKKTHQVGLPLPFDDEKKLLLARDYSYDSRKLP